MFCMEQEEYQYDLFDYFLLDQIRIRIESLINRSDMEKRCPFCNGVGVRTDKNNVTCFKCDYTVKLSVWDSR